MVNAKGMVMEFHYFCNIDSANLCIDEVESEG